MNYFGNVKGWASGYTDPLLYQLCDLAWRMRRKAKDNASMLVDGFCVCTHPAKKEILNIILANYYVGARIRAGDEIRLDARELCAPYCSRCETECYEAKLTEDQRVYGERYEKLIMPGLSRPSVPLGKHELDTRKKVTLEKPLLPDANWVIRANIKFLSRF